MKETKLKHIKEIQKKYPVTDPTKPLREVREVKITEIVKKTYKKKKSREKEKKKEKSIPKLTQIQTPRFIRQQSRMSYNPGNPLRRLLLRRKRPAIRLGG